MNKHLFHLLLLTQDPPVLRYVDSFKRSAYVDFHGFERFNNWVSGEFITPAVMDWEALTEEDLPKYAAYVFEGPDLARPHTTGSYLLKMAAQEYLAGCPGLTPFLKDRELALRARFQDLYHLREEINSLLERYRRGE